MSGVLVNGDSVESDPAADFLAREQDELAGLGDDLPDVRSVKLDEQGGFDDFEMLAGSSAPAVDVAEDPFGMSAAATDVGAEDAGAFGSPMAAPAVSFSSGPFDGNEDASARDDDYYEAPKVEEKKVESEARSPAFSPIPSSNSNREEPEKIRKWREDQKIRLEEKDRDEEVQKGKLREQAKRELEEWYKAHEEQIGKTKACNRAAEKEYQAMTAEVVPGQEWDRIAKLCEFNPKLSRASKDTSRMRSIILQLKQSPPNKANSVAS